MIVIVVGLVAFGSVGRAAGIGSDGERFGADGHRTAGGLGGRVGKRGRCAGGAGSGGGRNVGHVHLSLRGSRGDRDRNCNATSGAQVGLINLQAVDAIEVRAGRRREVQAAVEQLATLERGRLGNAVEGFQRLVDLRLIGGDLVIAQRTGVRAFGHQTANVVQQRADLAQGAVGRRDHLVGAVGVADRSLECS